MRRIHAALLALCHCHSRVVVVAARHPRPTPAPPGGTTYKPGEFLAASTFAAQCKTPRTGTDPDTGKPYPDKAGSTTLENYWLRSWTNDLYLWYSEVPDRIPR